jgi:DNA polymerase-4
VTRSITSPAAISATLTLTEVATQLAQSALADHPDEQEITLLAVSVSNLQNESPVQLELPLPIQSGESEGGLNSATGSTRGSADRSVDAIRRKFGRSAVGYAAVMFSNGHRVPDEFRELAEHSTSRQSNAISSEQPGAIQGGS